MLLVYADQCFKSPQYRGYGCIHVGPNFSWHRSDTPLRDCTYRITFYCVFGEACVFRWLHWADPEIMDGAGDQGPPDHSLVDVDTPCGENVSDHKSIAKTF